MYDERIRRFTNLRYPHKEDPDSFQGDPMEIETKVLIMLEYLANDSVCEWD